MAGQLARTARCATSPTARATTADTSSCLECSGDVTATVGLLVGVVAAVLVALATIAVFRRRCSKQFERLYKRLENVYLGLNLRSKIKQLFTLYQIITRLEDVFLVPMPEAVQNLLDKLSVVTPDASALGLPMGCLNLGTFEQVLMFDVFAPIVLIGAIAAVCALAALRPTKRGGRAIAVAVKEGLVQALPACLIVSFLAFPMVASLAFEAFSCEDFDDGTSYLSLTTQSPAMMTPVQTSPAAGSGRNHPLPRRRTADLRAAAARGARRHPLGSPVDAVQGARLLASRRGAALLHVGDRRDLQEAHHGRLSHPDQPRPDDPARARLRLLSGVPALHQCRGSLHPRR